MRLVAGGVTGRGVKRSAALVRAGWIGVVTVLAAAGSAPGVSLDILNNPFILQANGNKQTLLQQVTNDVRNGRIISSTTAGNPNYAVMVYDDADLGLSTIANQPVNSDSVIAIAALRGDTDHNGVIDGADFDRWFGHNGSTGVYAVSRGDLDMNGIVDGADFDIWFGHNGLTVSTASASMGSLGGGGGLGAGAVPEPGSLVLVGLGCVGLMRRRRRYPDCI